MLATTPRAKRPVAIVVAMPQEAAVFGRGLPCNKVVPITEHLSIFICGIGRANAQRGAQALLRVDPASLVSLGTAGGLSPNLANAACLLPDRVLSDEAAYETDGQWRERLMQRLRPTLEVHTGGLFCSAQIIATQADKKRCYNETGAVAVDMESSAVAQVATQAGLSFVCIKAILDTAETALPSFLSDTQDDKGFPDKAKFGMAIAKHPARLRDAARLARDFARARQTLAQVLQLTDAQLQFR